ncbi:ASCH domain-containing protein [Facklamia miroungae]|uniref:Predicted transcriptional regulator, contains an HTH and PUA-like domains n=1 Tax=Facklamia miroungae TaxID=120956 RepID=A0A1G7RXY8_9LACT|nr:ASCH domain-containing protein [Facklamia miroungae]NKZ29234.1 ASCH domain-containing protein [Facklamia miroungae]SDG15627.1 Predicted transcriptional regulator, contains an HTH and PUA-like domains [Facklamia miroungae]
MKVLLSIKPEFVEEIMEGRKKFEYRKNIFKRPDVSSVVVYATKPYGKVVGEFEIERIIKEKPNKLWELTQDFSGITQKFFDEYFKDRKTGFAIQIRKFIEYDEPMDLKNYDNRIKTAPQSFLYLEG